MTFCLLLIVVNDAHLRVILLFFNIFHAFANYCLNITMERAWVQVNDEESGTICSEEDFVNSSLIGRTFCLIYHCALISCRCLLITGIHECCPCLCSISYDHSIDFWSLPRIILMLQVRIIPKTCDLIPINVQNLSLLHYSSEIGWLSSVLPLSFLSKVSLWTNRGSCILSKSILSYFKCEYCVWSWITDLYCPYHTFIIRFFEKYLVWRIEQKPHLLYF